MSRLPPDLSALRWIAFLLIVLVSGSGCNCRQTPNNDITGTWCWDLARTSSWHKERYDRTPVAETNTGLEANRYLDITRETVRFVFPVAVNGEYAYHYVAGEYPYRRVGGTNSPVGSATEYHMELAGRQSKHLQDIYTMKLYHVQNTLWVWVTRANEETTTCYVRVPRSALPAEISGQTTRVPSSMEYKKPFGAVPKAGSPETRSPETRRETGTP